MSKLRSHLACLIDPATPDEKKLKAAQEVSENLETIVSSQHYPNFLETAIPIFLQLLKEGDPLFASDNQAQQLRKLVLELIHRLPTNDHLNGHVKTILSTMFGLLEVENEENVLVCLRIIIELHKHFKPSFSDEITRFLQFVKKIYADLPNTMATLFEPGGPGSADDSGTKGASVVLPKAATSLKVFAELPIIVVVMYQVYKQTVYNIVAEFIPLTMNAIILQPSAKARQAPTFNKEVYVDFVAVQIKFLSFLAYIIKIFQDQVNQYAPNMVQGMLSLLKNCPQEVAQLRRELIIAARHILSTDLRNRFIPCIDQLLDEELLIGSGWTTRETVRSMAYSILVDLVHHIRGHLSLPHLSLAVQLFSRNVHDNSLPVGIQNMSCKILLNLVESIRLKTEREPAARELLMRMVEVFVLKFQSIAEFQIPELFGRCSNSSQDGASASPGGSDHTSTSTGNGMSSGGEAGSNNRKQPLAMSPAPINGVSVTLSQPIPLTVGDCRGLVKTLVCGMKTITWGVGSCKSSSGNTSMDFSTNQDMFFPHETEQFVRLFRHGVVALDIYRVTNLPNGNHVLRNSNCQTVKTKEEKEVLEHFAGVFTMMGMTMFKEIFSEMIEYLVDRIQTNYALQLIPNSFLSNSTTSATFASILLSFLLQRMDSMGENMEQSNLYLKLFKLVFGSVTLFAQENELMLKPHLHEIVNQSMSLANTAQEPCNYFLLLRALFRSIGGGSHEQLYQEFLPLLSNLLQGLNRLQSGQHKQYMKDLFVELCLTVPVRLSSLLPYLHMLMDPLVSALNGSQTLINQGLRTLELCVDNLQPDFLYDHIQPVRAELMQALWSTLHNHDDTVATVAFRVLGKFGGSNRKMLSTPQPLKYRETLQDGAAIRVDFPGTEGVTVALQAGPIIEAAVKILRPNQASQSIETFYRQEAWHIIQAFLVGMLNLGDSELDLYQLLRQVKYQPSDLHSGRLKQISLPQCTNKEARASFETALCGVFISSCLRDLRSEALVFMAGIVKHITTVAVVQQCSTTNLLKQPTQDVVDVYVLLDAITKCMSSEEKELSKIGELALNMMIETSTIIVGDREKAADLPLFEVMADKLCSCCYERAWFAKSGGCTSISFLVDKMPLMFVLNHQLSFVMAFLYVLLDLINEVSSGTVTLAKKHLKKLLEVCNTPLKEEDKATLGPVQEKSFHLVSRHLVKEVISPNENVRMESHASLTFLASITGKTVTEIMEPHREILADMIPPKKHLLKHQPVSTQIALMDGNTFCTSLTPRLFSINLSVPEHQTFFQELLTLCDSDDATLSKLPCYRLVTSLVPLKVSALAALAACHYLPEVREKIFTVLYKTINSHQSVKELQEAGKEAMKKFMADHSQADIELVHSALRPLLMMLGDYRNLSPPLLSRLTYMIELFPTSFNEKMCNSLMSHLRSWIDVLHNSASTAGTPGVPATPNGSVASGRKGEDQTTVCLRIMNMLHMLPASTFRLFEPLLALSIKGEKALGIELGSPFREPVLKFALRYPTHTIDFFLCRLFDTSLSRLFISLLKHKDGAPLREVLAASPHKIISTTFSLSEKCEAPIHKRQELQFQGISLCFLLVEEDPNWIKDKRPMVECLKKVWMNENYSKKPGKDSQYWSECPMLLKSLLAHCKHHLDDVHTLFQLLRVYLNRHINSFHFLTTFLENDVAKGYSIEQKRKVFFVFVEMFSSLEHSQELKAKILQYVLIPMFSASFTEGNGDLLLGGPPDPEHDSDENIISVFINKMVNPDKPFGSTDSVCILLLQFSSLLVEHAAPHIHDSNNKKQGAKLRRLMTFAWPCLLPKQCVDPATKYHGHLLLAHIIAKFAIHKRIVLQVFHSLLKAHAVEARSIVRQALNILTPVVPVRMEDANATLVHWTKKIIVEEGHSVAQLIHMLQLLCRHHKVYYPVRQHLVQHMVTSIQRLGLSSNATIEQRKLAVDLAEVIIKWEFQRVNELNEAEGEPMDVGGASTSAANKDAPPRAGPAQGSGIGMKRSASDGTLEPKHLRAQAQVADPHWALDKQHVDSILNFLIRLACQVNDPQPLPASATPISPGEALSKRCVSIIKTALKPEIWPNIDIKLVWFSKLLEAMTQESSSGSMVANYANICTALDLLSFLIQVLPHQVVLSALRTLHKGVSVCMSSGNTKIVRYVHSLLTRLVSMFPPDQVPSEHEELDPLYSTMSKMITDGLVSFEKTSSLNLTQLQCTLMILKAACTNNPSYMDNFLGMFSKMIQRLHKEHVSTLSTSQDTQTISELLQWSLDLCKSRVHCMPPDARKAFMNIMTSLIEKSPDPKLLKTLTKIVDEWIRLKPDQPVHLGPTLREKTLLLSRMMIFFEKRFPDELDLLTPFLDIVIYIYKNEPLNSTELTVKLEPAFLCGLRCSHIPTRNQFFETFNGSVQKKLFERLLYIVCSQNWEHCGGYFWIKHCIELVMMVTKLDTPIQLSPETPRFPSISFVGPIQTPQSHDVTEPPVISSQLPDELMEGMDSDRADGGGSGALEKLTTKLNGFISDARNVKTSQLLLSVSSLCHWDTDLANYTWVELFPKMWGILSDRQRTAMSSELSPFMCSGAHLSQMDSHPSAVGAFLEGVFKCDPQPHIKSCILKYLGKTHNFWHGAALLLEARTYIEGELPTKLKEPPRYDGKYTDQILDPLKHETLDSLSELYSTLNEDDLWAGLWMERCQYPETAVAIAYESQGLFEVAQESYEAAMQRARDFHNTAQAPPTVLPEYKLWEEHWCRCARELGQWETLNDFGKSQNGTNPFLVLENAWRVQDWTAMKDSSTQAEPICSENYSARLNLLRGFLALCYPDEQRLNAVEKLIEAASIQSIKQWRRLPEIVSHAHIPLLQLSQQIMELQEATTIHSGLQSGGLNRPPFQTEIKTIFKTWKNRLPNCSDDLSHWSDVFSWRQIHYKHLIKAYEGTASVGNNQAMLIVHHLASAIIHYAKIARKHRLYPVCLVSLSKIHSIPSVPVLDCFQKIKEQVKCYLQMSGLMEDSELQEAMDVIDSTNLKYFTKEMIAEFMSLKGSFLAQIGNSSDANKSFSAAVQLHDSLVKGWSQWGEYLHQLFELDGNITLGLSIITCYLHACRTQKETKCRKYLARIIWLLTHDDQKGTLAEAVDKYYNGISPNHWLPWIPQLLTCLVRQEGSHILNLLCSVGKAYPQAVYFPIRTLYLTLKMEQREKVKADLQSKASTPTRPQEPTNSTPSDSAPPQDELKNTTTPSVPKTGGGGGGGGDNSSLPTPGGGVSNSTTTSTTTTTTSAATSSAASSTTSGDPAPIRAPASLWRCSRIMHLLRDLHPTLLSALEGIVDQMIWFRENWYEELLRQLNEGLMLCQSAAFEKRSDISNARISQDMMQFVRKLVSTFGIGLEQTGGSNSGSSVGPLSHEVLAKRAQAAAQDPAFQRLKAQFASDFDFNSPNAQRIHTLMSKLKRWIKILELKTKSLQKSFLLEDRCRFLSNFSLATAEVELPGEYLVPKPMPYYVRIARFMPRVEIVQKYNSTVRRLYIQGHNGKIYPYLVLNDSQVHRCRSEERVLQLFNMVNLFLSKDKECCRRNLLFTVPRVVSVSPQMRLVEDHTSNITLADIFKQHCSSHGLDWDCVIVQYYERLAQLQLHGEKITPLTLQTIFTQIQTSIAPHTMLKDWALQVFSSSTDYWTFRKQVTLQLSLHGIVEFIFHLSRLDSDMFQIASNNGQLSQTFHVFDIDSKGELDANRPVPFRLTPPLQTFLTQIGITGPLQLSMLAASRCLVQPHFSLESILKAILRDEFIAWKKRDKEVETSVPVSTSDVENTAVIKLVSDGVSSIMTRLYNLAEFEDGKSKVTLLVTEAANSENICRMDPAWNPWV